MSNKDITAKAPEHDNGKWPEHHHGPFGSTLDVKNGEYRIKDPETARFLVDMFTHLGFQFECFMTTDQQSASSCTSCAAITFIKVIKRPFNR